VVPSLKIKAEADLKTSRGIKDHLYVQSSFQATFWAPVKVSFKFTEKNRRK
jgi:hypothetical protein